VAAPPSPAAGGGGRPAAGLVSDDEADNATGFRKGMARPKEGSVGSVHDDSTGHFTGPPGSVIDDRFRVVRQVGMGTFGRVLECLDLTRPRRSRGRRRDHDDEGPRVAIKIVRKIKRYYESAQIEAKIVDALNRRGGRGTSHCAVMFDAFTWNQHFCMVFECLGPSLYDFLKRHRYQPFPYFCIRDFSQQLLETLDFLHGFGLIHTDLKPENIILMNHRETTHRGRRQSFQIPESTRIKVIDFGSATYEDEKKSKIVNTRQYRAPEVILGIGWNKAVDLWSIGCILMELYTGDLLFPTHDNIEHLAQMEKVIGPFPRRVLREARKSDIASKAFDRTGKHREGGVLSEDSAAYVSGMQPLENIIRREDDRLLQLMRRLLVIDPQDRGSAYECLRYRL
jgi:serine/threonine protein kinase